MTSETGDSALPQVDEPTIVVPVPAQGGDYGYSPAAIPRALVAWLRRHWLSLLVGVIPGVFLGLRTAQMVTEGGMSDLAPIFDLLLIAPTVVVLLAVAAIAKRSGPAIAAAALVGSWLLAWFAGTFVWH